MKPFTSPNDPPAAIIRKVRRTIAMLVVQARECKSRMDLRRAVNLAEWYGEDEFLSFVLRRTA